MGTNGHLARRLDALEGELLDVRRERELRHTALHLAARRGWSVEIAAARLRELVSQLQARFGDDVEAAKSTLAVERGLDFEGGIVAEIRRCQDHDHVDDIGGNP
jgi:phosphoserine phosphatase